MTVTSLAMNGNAYWLLNKNDRGQVNNAQVLNPNAVAVKVSDSGVMTFQYGDKTYRRDQIKHLKLLRVPGSVYGLGPIQAARQELEGQLGLRDYQANWFVNSGVPTGVLSSDQVLNQELAEQYRDRWLELQKDRTVAVLGSGVTYSPTLISPKDALFIEVSNFSVNQVARMFGIPGLYLTSASEGTSLTYSTTESIDAAYLKYTLSQYLVEIESALSDLIPRGQTVRFKADALLRTDTAARYAAYAIGIDKGFMSTDEVRASEGLTGAAPQKVDGAPV
jgi:HK97 family phage portal protein